MPSTQPHSTYELNDQGIHIFRILKATRQSFDEYLSNMEQAIDAHQPEKTFRLLVDTRPDGMPPFAHSIPQARHFLNHVALPPDIRVVYLHHNDPVLQTMSTFLNVMRVRSQRVILSRDQEELAVRWLLSNLDSRDIQQLQNKITL